MGYKCQLLRIGRWKGKDFAADGAGQRRCIEFSNPRTSASSVAKCAVHAWRPSFVIRDEGCYTLLRMFVLQAIPDEEIKEVSKYRRVRSRVFLVAYGQDEAELFRVDVGYDDYYDGETPLIDSNEYRASRGVFRVTGEIFDSKGVLQQSFENKYQGDGKYSGGKISHADGTIVEC
jgi:hypothetical protein